MSLVDHVALTDCQAYGRLAGVSVQISSATFISWQRATWDSTQTQYKIGFEQIKV